jgi:DNA repair protein RecN (Recombination protein N)
MLDELRVRDLALISNATITFAPGLTVLTGETGTGKTALLTALKLLIGERADSTMVRDGAPEARAEARFILSPAAIASGDNPADSCELVATRRLSADGRSRCTLNDSMVTVGALGEQVGPLVDLHGQHEHQKLLKAAAQREALDAYGGEQIASKLARYQESFDAARAARAEVERLQQAAHTSAQALDAARFLVQEVGAVAPVAGEYEELEAQLPRLRNGEDLALGSNTALAALRDEGGAADALGSALAAVEQLEGIDPELDGLIAQIRELTIEAEDVGTALRAYRDGVAFDPSALEEALDRLGQLEGLCRRFGPRMDDVFEGLDAAEALLADTGNLDERLTKAQTDLAACEEALRMDAQGLAKARAKVGKGFAEALGAAVQDLAMQGAVFNVTAHELAFEHWTRDGSCTYSIDYQPGATQVARPLAKIASGGELSRVMLALKCLLSDAEPGVTLVFDEIDTGIGGAAANAVAERLHELAGTHQVIVVTHLAQIAAVADSQWVVSKSLDASAGATTSIQEVRGDARVTEIARMLSGTDDATALQHAREMLK